MTQTHDPHHQFLFGLAAFGVIVLLGTQANVRGNSLSALEEAFGNSAVTVGVPIVAVGGSGAWLPVGVSDAVLAVSEKVCDGSSTYVEPHGYAISKASFTVSLDEIPEGAVITGLSIAPCIAAIGGAATSDISPWYAFFGEHTLLQDTDGEGARYVLRSGSYNNPTPQPARTFIIPAIVKTKDTKLEVGVESKTNGGGIRLSNLGVTITYTPPLPEGTEVVEAFAGSLESTVGDDASLFVDAVITWDLASAKRGGQLEVQRIDDGGNHIGVPEFATLIDDRRTARFPIVIGGIAREGYRYGIGYAFHIVSSDGTSISEEIILRPEEDYTMSQPSGIKATYNRTGKRIEITWNDTNVATNPATFSVERASLANTLVWQPIGETALREWLDLGPLQTGNYFYRVRAVRALGEGTLYSSYSDIVPVLLTDSL